MKQVLGDVVVFFNFTLKLFGIFVKRVNCGVRKCTGWRKFIMCVRENIVVMEGFMNMICKFEM